MASIGHIAVGMAAARIDRPQSAFPWSSAARWAALSMLPDADVIGFFLGVDYGSPWGHRGFTHSLVFAGLVGLVAGVMAGSLRRPSRRIWLLATLVVSSHPLLDTLTNGGLGCALFWPFDDTRYFAPWRPIPVSPIGLAFISPYGVMVAAAELILFAPIFAFALWPRHPKTRGS
jgi:inner membrane protein